MLLVQRERKERVAGLGIVCGTGSVMSMMTPLVKRLKNER